MSPYHRLASSELTKKAYAPQGNPYGQLTPTPSMGGAEVWQSAPGLQPPPAMGMGQKIWRHKGQIAGNLAGWSAGAAAGTAVGTAAAPFTFGLSIPVGAAVGGIVGGLAGSYGGDKLGEMADNGMNAHADRGRPYRPPVTDLASYGANMMAQSIDDQRAKGIPRQ